MEDIIDLIASDSNPSEVSNQLKNILFTKAAERVETERQSIATSMFDGKEPEEPQEEE